MRTKKTRCVCGKKLRLPKNRVGQIGKCPRCQRPISVSQEILMSPEEEVTIASDVTEKVAPFIGKEFGHYRVIDKLGRGGMGVVYKVEDTVLKRIVALKIMLNATSQQVQRFQKEKQALAQLKHPNIVQLLEVGSKPQNYYTMEYVAGETLDHIEKPQKSYSVALLFQKIAEALYVAHNEEIIHRDIKPSNIMIGKDGEPKLMDFGLVKFAKDSQVLSKTGDMLGTISYMPPEQANGEKVDYTSDIYSLGATLYQVLTGRPPFQGETSVNIIYQICYKDVVEPRFLNPDIPADLEAICLKCLEKSKSRRYSTAKKLAEDLENFCLHKTITARVPSSFTRMRKFIFRNKMMFSVISIFLLALIATTAFYVHFLKQSSARALKAEKLANIEKLEKEKDAQVANIRLSKIAFNMAIEAGENRKWQDCAAFAATSFNFIRAIPQQKANQTKTQTLIKAAYLNSKLMWRTGSYLDVERFAKSKDEKFLLINSSKTKLELCNSENGQIYRQFTTTRNIQSFTISSNGKFIVVGTATGTIEIWDVYRSTKIKTIHVGDKPVMSVHVLANNDVILATSKSRQLTLWNIHTKKKIASFTFSESITATTINPTKNEFAVATKSKSSQVHLFRYKDKKIQNFQKLKLPFSNLNRQKTQTIKSLKFDQQGRHLASISEHSYHIWKTQNWQLHFRHIISNDSGTSTEFHEILSEWKIMHNYIDFSKNGDFFAFISKRKIYFGKIKNPTSLSKIRHNSSAIATLSFLGNDKLLIADEKIHTWNITNGKLTETNNYHLHQIRYLKTNGKFIASVCWRNKIIIWEKNGGKKFGIQPGSLENITFYKGKIVWLTRNNLLFFWDIQQQKVIQTIDVSNFIKQKSFYASAFNKKGNLIAYLFAKEIIVWNIEKQQIVYRIQHKIQNINTGLMYFSPNGKIISINQWNQVKVYQLEKKSNLLLDQETIDNQVALDNTHLSYISTTPNEIIVKNLYTNNTFSVKENNARCIMSTRYFMATASKEIVLYTKHSHQKIASFFSGKSHVNAMLFLEKDNILITGHFDGEIKAWDLSFLQPTRQIKTSPSFQTKIAFSPDGKNFAYLGKKIIVYTTIDNKILWQKQVNENIDSVCYSYDSKIIMTIDADNQIIHYSATTGNITKKLDFNVNKDVNNEGLILHDSFYPTPNPSNIISTEGEIWNIKTNKHIKSAAGFFMCSIKGKYLLTHLADELHIWNGNTLG